MGVWLPQALLSQRPEPSLPASLPRNRKAALAKTTMCWRNQNAFLSPTLSIHITHNPIDSVTHLNKSDTGVLEVNWVVWRFRYQYCHSCLNAFNLPSGKDIMSKYVICVDWKHRFFTKIYTLKETKLSCRQIVSVCGGNSPAHTHHKIHAPDSDRKSFVENASK